MRRGVDPGHGGLWLADLLTSAGYTDMARGVAKSSGVPLDFELQQSALSPPGWAISGRWHISLSTWFRDYVYISTWGKQERDFHDVPQLVSDVLHFRHLARSRLTFVIWGTLHALGVMITRELERSAFYRERVPQLAKQLGVFVFVSFTWIFFRAGSLSDALLIVNRIFTSAWQIRKFRR